MKEKPNYYAILPAVVRYDKELKSSEKLLYAEITALANKEGYCWSTNNYFAKLYDVTKITVSNWVSNLEQKGYLQRELIYKEKSKEVLKRKLIPIKEKFNTPIKEKVKGNNTSSNNTSNNNTSNNINKPSDKPDTESDEFSLTKKDSGRYDYPKDYERLYSLYPYSRGNKKAGWRKWAATRRKNVSQDDLIEAVKNYAAKCKKDGTEEKWVMHIKKFFGPDEYWKEYLGGNDNGGEFQANNQSEEEKLGAEVDELFNQD